VPGPSLARHVRAYFAIAGVAAPRRLLPDGCVDLLFNIDDVPGEPAAVVIGVTARPRLIRPASTTRRFGVSFACGEALQLVGGPMHLFEDRLVDLRELLGSEAARLSDDLRALPTDARRAERMDRFLAAQAAQREPAPRCVRGALTVLRSSGGRLSVPALARDLGVTERSLQRAFREWIGMSPKTVARIVRLQALLETLGRGAPASWSRLAQEHGFADQAHLNHEFRVLTGTAPGEFLRERRLSEFYNPTLGFAVSVEESPRGDRGRVCEAHPDPAPASPSQPLRCS
jgi:AraC-like DNA-binding protein